MRLERFRKPRDVTVIGAGFTGLSAARTLAKKGANVVVLEAETIGWGASSRNGGMVLTGMKLGVNKLISMYGRELTQRMYAASLDTITCVEQIVKEEGIECSFMRTGHLEVACKQAHFDDYARQVEVIAREFNHQMRVVQRSELSTEIGSTIYFGGMVDESSVGVNPGSICCGTWGCCFARWCVRIRAHSGRNNQACFAQGNTWMESHHLTGTPVGSRSLRRHERLHVESDSGAGEENHPNRLLHHHDGSSARSSGTGTEPSESPDLRFEKLPLLLSAHPRSPNAVRWASGLFSGERRFDPSECRAFATRDDRGVSAASRCKSGICLGRNARLRI